jgi:hypothetical protein
VTFNGCIDKLVPVHNYISTVNISLSNQFSDTGLTYVKYVPKSTDRVISRSDYINRLHGFWLGECIANWTGLITELDKVGMPRTGPFYTDLNWKGPDLKSMWGSGPAPIIDFVFTSGTEPWGSDDDTDMEYLYQYLLEQHKTSTLTGEQIRDGWLKHIYDNKQQTPFGTDDDPSGGYQNFLWVSNQQAFDLMRDDQMIPPATSDPVNNQSYDMIDAQLTTEIFGFFAPSRPDVALKMAYLPIRTTANCNAELISKFYVTMYSLTSYVNNVDSLKNLPIKEKIFWMADLAASKMPDSSYASKMYKFVRAKYNAHPDSADWEATRDSVYYRYQGAKNSVQKADGYVFSGHGDSMSNSGGFDAGINFASSLVSLFYGQGDLPRTIKIGTLCGWDSDNPTATWGGLLGFMLGKDGIEKAFNKTNFSDTYLISRTRKIFPDRNGSLKGEDSFQMMSQRGVFIIDRVVQNEMKGGVNLAEDVWYVPDNGGL